MAVEPGTTSSHYDPGATYTPPVGRLPILGKMRAEIDRIRAAAGNDLNQVTNRNLAQIDSNNKITGELAALATQTADGTRKIDADIAAQLDKTEAEVQLLDQKAVTELTQTSDNIPAGTGLNILTTVQGVIEKQKGLFQKQTDGFDRDAEQKLAKIMVDTWSVRQTTDGALAAEAGLADSDITTVLAKARTGIVAT